MEIIPLDLLAAVVGGAGENVTKTEVSGSVLGQRATVRTETRIPDSAACRAEVKQACDDTNRGWLGVDRAAAGQCFLNNIANCPK